MRLQRIKYTYYNNSVVAIRYMSEFDRIIGYSCNTDLNNNIIYYSYKTLNGNKGYCFSVYNDNKYYV